MTAKDAQGMEQTGTRREQTVDVICCSKPVVDDYSKYSGASTPYKRWSKCTMEKVGGSVFAETYRGECINY